MSTDVKVSVRSGDKAITPDEAKSLIGWTEEPENKTWDQWDLKVEGKKIRLANRKTNRPLRLALAKRYALEFLRGKWELNGETIIQDTKGQWQNGQHRLVGLILADYMKESDEHWKEYGKGTPVFETIVVTGISPKVADTLDLGQKRSLGDVYFRRNEFGKEVSEKEQQRLANTLAGAVRLVWLRTGGMSVSDAPHFPHSEALEFGEAHPRILEAVQRMTELEAGNERRISAKISLPFSAGLFYLMATAKSKPNGDEPSFSLWKRANEFWTAFAEGEGLTKGSPVLALQRALVRGNAGSASGRDEVLGMVVKAWNAFVDDRKVEAKDLKVKKGKDANTGRMILVESPRIGGLDIEIEMEEDESVSPGSEEEQPPRKKGGSADGKSRRKKSGNDDGEGETAIRKGIAVIVSNPEEGDWTGTVLGTVDGDHELLRIKSDGDGDTYAVMAKDIRPRKKK